ncbi:hypothetical protein AGMMS49936_10060 [Endomicrobiia bacterium]|nr:hypothetical protein AGMMS49936_10060 [Endomicrobiia bacterium]
MAVLEKKLVLVCSLFCLTFSFPTVAFSQPPKKDDTTTTTKKTIKVKGKASPNSSSLGIEAGLKFEKKDGKKVKMQGEATVGVSVNDKGTTGASAGVKLKF